MRSDNPAHDWDVHQGRRDDAWASAVNGKTCLDCGNCRLPDVVASIGFCLVEQEFVYDFDTPAERDCRDWL